MSVVDGRPPGSATEDLQDKIALRVVQHAVITLDGVRVPRPTASSTPPPSATPPRSCA